MSFPQCSPRQSSSAHPAHPPLSPLPPGATAETHPATFTPIISSDLRICLAGRKNTDLSFPPSWGYPRLPLAWGRVPVRAHVAGKMLTLAQVRADPSRLARESSKRQVPPQPSLPSLRRPCCRHTVRVEAAHTGRAAFEPCPPRCGCQRHTRAEGKAPRALLSGTLGLSREPHLPLPGQPRQRGHREKTFLASTVDNAGCPAPPVFICLFKQGLQVVSGYRRITKLLFIQEIYDIVSSMEHIRNPAVLLPENNSKCRTAQGAGSRCFQREGGVFVINGGRMFSGKILITY